MLLRPLVLIVPSLAAAIELPRRLAARGRAVAGLYPFRLLDLARALAEPVLLGAGLRAWDPGHGPRLAAAFLEDGGAASLPLPPELPHAPVAAALARTLTALRYAALASADLDRLSRVGAGPDDRQRLAALAALYARFQEAVEGRFADPATLFRSAVRRLPEARWLQDADVLVVDDLEPAPVEQDLLTALAHTVTVRLLRHERPPNLPTSSLMSWAETQGVGSVPAGETPLAPLFPNAAGLPAGLRRLRTRLFEPPGGEAIRDDSVELVTAPGEAAEVRAVVRRLIREASRGVLFEDMGIVVPRPEPYAPLFTDLLERVRIPYRLHPSLPLRCGRCARSLLLLLRCRGLQRTSVVEFLTFAPLRVEALLGPGAQARPARWDEASRQAGVTSGHDRWRAGLRAYAESARAEASRAGDDDRRGRHLQRAAEADTLLGLVERLRSTLDGLTGRATWPEWSERLRAAFDEWIGAERDRQAVDELLLELAGLGTDGQTAPFPDVEAVLEARFDEELLPAEEPATGGLHVGALDAIAGLPFRVVAIVGLVEGGYPGTLRPDPFLLDAEREALNAAAAPAARGTSTDRKGQLSLLERMEETEPRRLLPTTQDRLLRERRRFHRALSQAGERLILSFPRADARTGRERLPSLFFAAAASALAGRPLSAGELFAAVVQDDPATLPLEHAVDASERDRARVLRSGGEAVLAVAAGSSFFKWSHLAAHGRWSRELTRFDGRVDGLPKELASRLDPATSLRPVSASSLANYARCGFLYLLKNVLGLEPAEEPEERLWLDPLEQGQLFHEVAEAFLRERRDGKDLPVRDDEASRRRLLDLARQRVDALVAGTPPRHRLLWEMRWRVFEDLLLRWLAREAMTADKATPAYFEVGFGSSRHEATPEPHSPEPLVVELEDGRRLRVSGKIDRIDTRPDGSLVLRDYKTGRAPKDDGGVFRGGRELQIPIYVLATRMLFPERTVADAFLDYVNGGRPVPFQPDSVAGEDFRRLLGDMTRAIAEGSFVQEPTTCKWCDFTAVCGPQPLLEIRQRFKRNDARLQRYLRLRDYR